MFNKGPEDFYTPHSGLHTTPFRYSGFSKAYIAYVTDGPYDKERGVPHEGQLCADISIPEEEYDALDDCQKFDFFVARFEVAQLSVLDKKWGDKVRA